MTEHHVPNASQRYSEVTEANIKLLVDSFYGKVRKDEVLGPVFTNKLGEDWTDHLDKLYDFWSSIMLHSKRYQGKPVVIHTKLTEIQQFHFDRWLELFRETCHEIFIENIAGRFIFRAETMAKSFKIAMFYSISDGKFVNNMTS